MIQNKRQTNFKDHRALTLLFALALVVVICAIGSVALNCVDSLQRHSQKIQEFNAKTEEKPVAITDPKLASEMDKRIYNDKIDPMIAFQVPMAEGSQIPFRRGMERIDKRQFADGASDFSQALAMVPVEARTKHSWSIGDSVVDRRIYLATLYEQRARCYMESGHYPQAVSDFTASIRLRPEYTGNYINRAKIYSLMGDKKDAAADIKKLASLSKSQPGLH